MAFKKVTVVLVPEDANRVRQFRISRVFVAFLIFFFVFSTASVAWLVKDYQTLRRDIPDRFQLEKRNREQGEQIRYLVQRIDEVTEKMAELKEFDRKLKVLVNLETGDDDAQFQSVGGSDSASQAPSNDSRSELFQSLHRSLDQINEDIEIGEQAKTQLHQFLQSQKKLLASTPSIWPTRGWLSSRFGYRISPFTGEREFHKGIDVATRMKAPIISPANGIVSDTYWDRGYGRVLIIKHGYGLVTKYAHLSKILVKKGQYVKRRQKIALVGDTGRSTGAHLHYEVHLDGLAVNPLNYILN